MRLQNFCDDLPLVKVVLDACNFLIILMPFSGKNDDIAVLRVFDAVADGLPPVAGSRHIFRSVFAIPVLISAMISITSSKRELSAVMTERSAICPHTSPISYRRILRTVSACAEQADQTVGMVLPQGPENVFHADRVVRVVDQKRVVSGNRDRFDASLDFDGVKALLDLRQRDVEHGGRRLLRRVRYRR